MTTPEKSRAISCYDKRTFKLMNELIYYLDSADIVTDHTIWYEEEIRQFLEYIEKASEILKKVRDRLREQIRKQRLGISGER